MPPARLLAILAALLVTPFGFSATAHADKLCVNAVMKGNVDWGGGTKWQKGNATKLCAGSTGAASAQDVIACFRGAIAQGLKWPAAIEACRTGSRHCVRQSKRKAGEWRQAFHACGVGPKPLVLPRAGQGPQSACLQAIPASLSHRMTSEQKTRLCGNRILEHGVKAPGLCIDEVMQRKSVAWAKGDGENLRKWNLGNAIRLCAETKSSPLTLACFRAGIAHGRTWQQAIALCASESRSGLPQGSCITKDLLDSRTGALKSFGDPTALARYFTRTFQECDRTQKQQAASQAAGAQQAQRAAQATSRCNRVLHRSMRMDGKGQGGLPQAEFDRLCGSQLQFAAAPAANCLNTLLVDNKTVPWKKSGQNRFKWNRGNAIKLCANTRDKDFTLGCFNAFIAEGHPWDQAIGNCRSDREGRPDDNCITRHGRDPRTGRVDFSQAFAKCKTEEDKKRRAGEKEHKDAIASFQNSRCNQVLDGKLKLNTGLSSRQFDDLCGDQLHMQSAPAANCLNEVMVKKTVAWGKGKGAHLKNWKLGNAIRLCARTRDQEFTLACFRAGIKDGFNWSKVLGVCESDGDGRPQRNCVTGKGRDSQGRINFGNAFARCFG